MPSGWICAVVHTGDRQFRLFTTHLQSPVAIDPTAATVQIAEANQLIQFFDRLLSMLGRLAARLVFHFRSPDCVRDWDAMGTSSNLACA